MERGRPKVEYQPTDCVREDDGEGVVLDKDPQPYHQPPYANVKINRYVNTGRPTFRMFDKSGGDRVEVKMGNFRDITNHMLFITKHRLAKASTSYTS